MNARSGSVARIGTEPETPEAATTVPAAARTMALFEVFAREKRDLTKSELARLLDLPESSCSDLLNTLHVLGYVSRTANSKRYYPTGRLLTAASAIAENDPLRAFGSEAVALLSQKTGETSTFGVLDGDAVKLIAVAEGGHRLRYVVNAGDRVSLHATALGKALLGASEDHDVSRLLRLKPLKVFSEHTKTDPKEVEDEIRAQRAHGWHKASEEGGAGISSYAISGNVGSTPVALSVIGPTDRMRQNEEQYIGLLREAQRAVFGAGDNDGSRRKGGRKS